MRPATSARGARSRFVRGHQSLAACPRARSISASSSGVRSLRRVHHHQRQIRVRHGLIAALDAQRLDHILPQPDARRVQKLHRNPAERRRLRHHVARGSRDLGHDGAVLLQQPVEQAALADVRPADDGERESFVHQLAVGEAGGQRRDRRYRSGSSRRRISSAGATLMSSSAKSIPASSSAINSSSCSFTGFSRRETDPSACCAAMRA